MKIVINILVVVLMVIKGFGQDKPKEDFWEQEMRQREIPNAKLGDLICLDDNGQYIICTGDEFEKILGFCTNVPFVTVNKAKGDNKITEHRGIASFENGKIKMGEYLCPSIEISGQVARCEKTDYPYAKAMESPNEKGTLFKVKILGHRREH